MANVKTTFQGQDSIDGVKVYTRKNVGKAYITGIEGEVQLRPLRCRTHGSGVENAGKSVYISLRYRFLSSG